jgi:hypothetical protein
MREAPVAVATYPAVLLVWQPTVVCAGVVSHNDIRNVTFSTDTSLTVVRTLFRITATITVLKADTHFTQPSNIKLSNSPHQQVTARPRIFLEWL